MNFNGKQIIQYLFSVLLGGGLLIYIFTIIDFQSLIIEMKKADISWILLSMIVSLFAHISRALRWNMLIAPLGYKVKAKNAVQAVLIGYFANLALPRLGEVSRCGCINKTDKVPVSVSFGSVISERIFDLILMLSIFLLAFLIEFERFQTMFLDLITTKAGDLGNILSGYLLVLIALFLGAGALIIVYTYKNRERLRKHKPVEKIFVFIEGLIQGLFSFTRINNKLLFLGHTLFIWFIYLLMIYFIFLSLPDAANLPFSASIVALALGSLGMAAPVQGGIGAYHIMVSAALLIYGVPEEKGLVIATILHTSQLVATVIFGSIALLNFIIFAGKKGN